MAEPGANGAVPLSVRDEGEGPPVLLIHGLGGSRSVWNLVVPLLTPRFRVLVPDLRGHGRSPSPADAAYGFTNLAQDLDQLLLSRDLASAHFVGLSAGALLALRMGLDSPKVVRSLTLIGGSVYTDAHTRGVAERWAEVYAHDGADGLSLRLLKDLYYPDWIEAHMDLVDGFREQIRRADFRGATLWAKEAAVFDERSRIASLLPPTLIVQAMDDQVVDATHGRILRQSIPRSQIRILPQTGHLVPIEKPAATAEAITEFVSAVEAHQGLS